MKKIIAILLMFVIIFISGCATPAQINEQIAETYRNLDSLSYDVKIIRTDTYDKSYTAYEITQIETGVREFESVEIPMVGEPRNDEVVLNEEIIYETVIGNSHILSKSGSEWDYSIFIEKPDKKLTIITGSHEPGISGGEMIGGTWYFRYSPARVEDEKKLICNSNLYYVIPDIFHGADVGVYSGDTCKESVENSIWQLPSSLDDESKFKVTISEEMMNGKQVIRADIESVTGEFFYLDEKEAPYHNVIIWFEAEDFKLVKFEGILAKSRKGDETSIGLSTTYTMIFDNVVFDPEIPSEMFDINLDDYEEVADLSERY